MADLLVACHCESQHGPVKVIGKEFNSIQYIDTNEGIHVSSEKCKPSENQFIQWYKIPNSSIDYIYGVSCPLYGELYEGRIYEDSSNMWRSLNKHGWNVLRANGKIIIPLNSNVMPDIKLKIKLKELMPLWAITVVSSVPFHIEEKDAERYIIFKKPTKGGRRRKATRKQKVKN